MSNRSPQHTWTYADYARLPDDGNRYEVLDGEVLVTPSPSPHHQRVLLRLSIALDRYVEEHRLGVVLPGVDVLFVTGQFLCPDLVFVPESAREGITNRGIELAPGLIVEVLSPTSGRMDKVKKPRRYGDFGVPEYWVADPKEQVVWVWRFAQGAREPERVAGSLEWRPSADVPALALETSEILLPL